MVGEIPEGLPGFALPVFDWDVMKQLIATAITISLIGFMEAISIAKAMAARTRQRLDANQELIGQGLSNMVSGCFSGYPGSGSFSRSAVNINAGAVTGVSSVVTGAVVGITLLWLTPLLYHLPQATLAAVIIMAVINLIKVEPIIHAWKAQPHDGVVAVVTFVLTLAMAPHLDKGIIVGVALSIGLFLYRSMRPRVAVLSRYPDGTMRDIAVHHLPTSPKISIMRFDGSLYFANAGYFETKVLEVVAANPELRYIIIDAEGINQLDATGEEVFHHLAERLKTNGIELLVARMKKQFMDTITQDQGLIDEIGEDHFFSRIQFALNFAWDGLEPDYDRETCPLRNPQHVSTDDAEIPDPEGTEGKVTAHNARTRMNDLPVLSILLLLPAVGAGLVAALPGTRPILIRRVAITVTTLTLILAWAMLAGFDTAAGGLQWLEQHTWNPRLGTSFALGPGRLFLPDGVAGDPALPGGFAGVARYP